MRRRDFLGVALALPAAAAVPAFAVCRERIYWIDPVEGAPLAQLAGRSREYDMEWAEWIDEPLRSL